MDKHLVLNYKLMRVLQRRDTLRSLAPRQSEPASRFPPFGSFSFLPERLARFSGSAAGNRFRANSIFIYLSREKLVRKETLAGKGREVHRYVLLECAIFLKVEMQCQNDFSSIL